MSTPAATGLARLSRLALCAAVAMGLGVACAVLAVAASTGMSGMSGMSETSSAAAPDASAGSTTGPGASSVVPAVHAQVASACETACAGVTAGDLCTIAAGLVVTGVMALLLASPRNTSLGSLARTRSSGVVRRRLRRRTPWLAPSSVALCVFRV